MKSIYFVSVFVVVVIVVLSAGHVRAGGAGNIHDFVYVGLDISMSDFLVSILSSVAVYPSIGDNVCDSSHTFLMNGTHQCRPISIANHNNFIAAFCLGTMHK